MIATPARPIAVSDAPATRSPQTLQTLHVEAQTLQGQHGFDLRFAGFAGFEGFVFNYARDRAPYACVTRVRRLIARAKGSKPDKPCKPCGRTQPITKRNRPMTDTAPPRRTGRRCGYPNNDTLDNARVALATALTKLARDPDPGIRQHGAQLALDAAQTLTEITDRATALARRQ